jgi:hypothetical protein
MAVVDKAGRLGGGDSASTSGVLDRPATTNPPGFARRPVSPSSGERRSAGPLSSRCPGALLTKITERDSAWRIRSCRHRRRPRQARATARTPRTRDAHHAVRRRRQPQPVRMLCRGTERRYVWPLRVRDSPSAAGMRSPMDGATQAQRSGSAIPGEHVGAGEPSTDITACEFAKIRVLICADHRPLDASLRTRWACVVGQADDRVGNPVHWARTARGLTISR